MYPAGYKYRRFSVSNSQSLFFPIGYGACAQYLAVLAVTVRLPGSWLCQCPPSLEQLSLPPSLPTFRRNPFSYPMPRSFSTSYDSWLYHLPQSHDIPALRACLPWLPTLCMPQKHFSWTVATAYVLTLFPVIYIYGLIRTLTGTGNWHLPQSCRQFLRPCK
jgi:hypothetical protein